jgi:WhiB family redox-sensing transcriptional regulator
VTKYAEIHALTPEDWRAEAACRSLPTEWWYPHDGMHHKYTVRARSVCERCPVREECLIAALRRNEDGIWGGYNIKERRRLNREYQVMKHLVCSHCRTVFEKPAHRQVVTLYCSDECRKGRKSNLVADQKRIKRAAS